MGVPEDFAYLAFLSENEMTTDLVEDEELFNIAIKSLSEKTSHEEQRFGFVKFLSSLVKLNKKHVKYFEENNGLQIISTQIDDSDNLILLTEVVKLLINCINISDETFDKKVIQSDLIKKISDIFSKLNKQYEEFSKHAATTPKALDSIQYYKSDTTRAILETIKTIKPNELIPMKLALDYISTEQLAISILQFFSTINRRNSKTSFEVSENFINTCNSLMKVFRGSRKVNQQVFETLSQCKIPVNVGNHVVT